ncbi:MAG TPA: site-2 protease family protein [Chthoniobacterales bacterium]|nr:site-2 protease family protein [Chthoniobacterales bacterium]
MAVFEYTQLSRRYNNPIWGMWEYLALCGMVILHEFGHAFACRQTGGRADQIMLWPLGGVAFVSPPPRPGAYLWSIAAGPLVNVVLVPIFAGLLFWAGDIQFRIAHPDVYRFVWSLMWMNIGLLIFNLLPIFPLDGGQLVRGVLWIWMGPTRSLQVASVIGVTGSLAIGLWAFYRGSIWLGILALFVFSQAQFGWREAKRLKLEADAAKETTAQPPPLPPMMERR